MQRVDASTRIRNAGLKILDIWREHSQRSGLPITVDDGCPALAKFVWNHDSALALQTIHTKLMLERGYLAGQAVYCTVAHDDEKILSQFDQAVGEVFDVIATALKSGDDLTQLAGGVLAEQGFGRLVK